MALVVDTCPSLLFCLCHRFRKDLFLSDLRRPAARCGIRVRAAQNNVVSILGFSAPSPSAINNLLLGSCRQQKSSKAFKLSSEAPLRVPQIPSNSRTPSIGMVLAEDDNFLEDLKPGDDSTVYRGDDFANILEILTPKDKFRFHKIPKFKALKLKLTPALVLQILEHADVRPSNKWKFFVWAKRQMGYKHTAATYNSIVLTLLDMRKFTSIRFLLEDMHRNDIALNVKSCLRMAKTFGHAGLLDSGVHSLRHMIRLGSPPTVRHMNLLVSALLKGNHHLKAYKAYREMAASGCEPDGHTFKILLRKLGRARELGLACQIFDEMRAIRCEPDAEASSILVSVLCEVSRIEDAVLVFDNFRRSGRVPSIRLYDILLRGLCEAREADRALELFGEIRSRGYQPSNGTSRALIDLLSDGGMDDDAQRCREYCVSSNIGTLTE